MVSVDVKHRVPGGAVAVRSTARGHLSLRTLRASLSGTFLQKGRQDVVNQCLGFALYVVTAESVVRDDSCLADISSDRSMFHHGFRVIMQVDESINFSQ